MTNPRKSGIVPLIFVTLALAANSGVPWTQEQTLVTQEQRPVRIVLKPQSLDPTSKSRDQESRGSRQEQSPFETRSAPRGTNHGSLQVETRPHVRAAAALHTERNLRARGMSEQDAHRVVEKIASSSGPIATRPPIGNAPPEAAVTGRPIVASTTQPSRGIEWGPVHMRLAPYLGATLGGADGKSASSASQGYDNAPPRAGQNVERDADPPSAIPFKTSANCPAITTEYIRYLEDKCDGQIPGGIVLDGPARGLPPIEDLTYDQAFNALVINESLVYFMSVPPREAAVLCRAIGGDERERVCVSLTAGPKIIYGLLPPVSDPAWDLWLADHFLGDIVFGRGEWTEHYLFPGGYRPETSSNHGNLAVVFTFDSFDFTTQENELYPAGAALAIRLVPLSQEYGENGGLLSDDAAIGRVTFPEYERNASHIRDHIADYRQERLMRRVFAYGELAAILRSIKQSGFDLVRMAEDMQDGDG